MAEPSPDDLLGWIWRSAAANPERIMVKDAHRNWTWKDLLARAHGYAAALRGIPAPIIPLFCGRNGDTIAAILGCLIAGRAFAPLAPDQPAERLQSCIERLQTTAYISTLEAGAPPLMPTTDLVGIHPKMEPENRIGFEPPTYASDGIAYVLFTSGSTGAPKGVKVSYGNLANTVAWSVDILSWKPDDVTGIVVNFHFDISMFDIFVALRNNVPIAVLSRPGALAETMSEIASFAATSIFAAPAFFSQFVRAEALKNPALRTVRRIISGGDFFPPAHVLAWMNARPDIEILNAWGPTETSIVNTMHLVTDADRAVLEQGQHVAVGRAHPRMPLRVVDEDLRPVPCGTPGEVCMLGACVTQGYLMDPELSARFYVEVDGQSAYRTQDLGVVDHAGQLRILGRLGSMTKINGHRVDFGEIEGAVTALPGVHRGVAFLRESELDIQELWLAVEPTHEHAPPDVFALKQALRRRLPPYMVPKRILFLPSLPLTANGKIDRRAVARCISST